MHCSCGLLVLWLHLHCMLGVSIGCGFLHLLGDKSFWLHLVSAGSSGSLGR